MIPDQFRPWLRVTALLLLLTAVAPARGQDEILPVRPGPMSQSLDGRWKFKYFAALDVGADSVFHQTAFDDTTWRSIAVPAHWELEGFAEPLYKHPAEGTGLYRTRFRVPQGWSGQKIFLHFAGVLYGFEVWVNGVKCGSWASGYNPVSFDVTDAVKPDGDNLLAVKVTTRSQGWEFDTNDCWALSGIYRDVTLFAAPATHFNDYTARTTLQSDGSAELRIEVTASASASVAGRLLSPTGEVVREFRFPLGGNFQGSTAFTVGRPQLWTAETPALYRLELTLQADGRSVQHIAEKIGLRQVTIDGRILRLNGRPIKLHGVDHHDLWPDVGRAATEEHLRRDLALIQAANINFIRTSHYPPHPRLIELCDELGIYVMCEVPFGGGDQHLTDPAYAGALLTRARATVKRDQNRPSVIVWSVGNENPITDIQMATGREVKRLDPTRPICFPTVGSYFDQNYGKFPKFVDIYSPHYPAVATLRHYAEALTRPVIATEYAHALGLGADRIQEEWEIMQAEPALAGGALWMFQDQGLLRTRSAPLADGEESPYVWLDAHRYYDTGGTRGMDGIVYSDRRPQVDYWQVRKVYSPVQIVERSLMTGFGAQSLVVHIANRFDFRSLAGFRLEWTLQRNGAQLQTGVLSLHAAAQAQEALAIPVTRPADREGNIDVLALRCLDEKGRSVYEHTVHLDAETQASVTQVLAAESKAGDLKREDIGSKVRVIHARFAVTLDRTTGEIAVEARDGRRLISGVYPHIGRRFTEAEKARLQKKGEIWTGAFLSQPTALTTDVAAGPEGIRLSVKGKYVRPDAPEQFLEGGHTLLVRPGGAIEVTYHYRPVNGRGSLLEAGLSLMVPANASEFRWIGAGPYAGYPGKDRLNEFGLYHLTRSDLNFQGNRRGVEAAVLSAPDGLGVSLDGPAMDVAVENYSAFTLLNHNALVSGRGNKSRDPETNIMAEKTEAIDGRFELRPLGRNWSPALIRWFGPPDRPAADVQKPYYRSYD